VAKQNSIVFRNCGFRQAALTLVNKEGASPCSRIHVRCDLSTPVMEEMGWSIGEGQVGGDLVGQLNCSHAIWTPNQKQLRANELQIEIAEAGDFKFVAVKNKDGEITGHELTMTLRSNQADTPALIAMFIAACGSERSALKLSYTKEPKQQTLPGTDEPIEDAQQSLDEEFADADQPGSPALASAMEMSEHRKRRKRKVQ
jgi:hypothetical protein